MPCCPHVETNQMTGFYTRVTLAFNGLITGDSNQIQAGNLLIQKQPPEVFYEKGVICEIS